MKNNDLQFIALEEINKEKSIQRKDVIDCVQVATIDIQIREKRKHSVITTNSK